MPHSYITEIRDRGHLAELLTTNPGLFIIKFGADWCGPCKQIESLVNDYFAKMPENVRCAIINIDQAVDVYSFLKSKKMVNGIPVILCYYKGNLNYIPNDIVVGAVPGQIQRFFETCVTRAKDLLLITETQRFAEPEK